MERKEFEMLTDGLWEDHFEMRFYFDNPKAADAILERLAYLYSEEYPGRKF